ncbi:uncharacterized protein LOC130693321 [Daphnia carinata]|uniref:uncharacterized protein LOC130693321 n=1 Tax=Daphnia carinata TaxID=120202 RepID=UPI00257F8C9A|nr:uncharacterized protein LOC130693321 [Daphnia carinata]XP_057372439.1 uncharacterized protein LOC130693321 [Daphnia carinata]
MDIFGSALISPTVSWAVNRNISTKSLKRNHEQDDEDNGEPDQQERLGKYPNYRTGVLAENLFRKSSSFRGKFKELFRRAGGSSEESQSLLITSRSKNTPVIPRDKIKIAGKRLRKALHQSIKYMAIGMENMGTMVYISTNVPSSVYYCRNNTSYDQTMPYY